MLLETDYLVVGAGTAGMAFTDELITQTHDADVLVVDRRHRPGGHWSDAYPFVRLHLPSAYYGVNSRPLGQDRIDTHGPNAGLYERATGSEICDYFGRLLEERFLPSGQVRFIGLHDYNGADGTHRLVSRLTGEAHEVRVRRKLVDATYLESSIPATHVPAFAVDQGVRMVPVNDLVHTTEPASAYVVLGGGKTSIDACLWLLEQGVDPGRIRWVRPQDSWFLDRAAWQPLEHLPRLLDGLATEVEVAAHATSREELFRGLEDTGRLVRLDPAVEPGAFRGGTVSHQEVALLREITDVVRLGRVRRIRLHEVELAGGTLRTDPAHLYVDCTAAGLATAAARPIFEAERITLQQVRYGSPSLNAALLAYLETSRDDVEEQNRLSPASPHPATADDWARMVLSTLLAAAAWRSQGDVDDWVESSRLNVTRGVRARRDEPEIQAALGRYVANVRGAVHSLAALQAG